MRTFVKVAAMAFAIATAALLMGSREAHAAPRAILGECVTADIGPVSVDCDDTSGEAGGVAGAQASTCADGVVVSGDASASCDGTSSGGAGGSGDARADAELIGDTSGRGHVCGNAVRIGGNAAAQCENGRRSGAAASSNDAAQADIDVLRWGLAVQALACANGFVGFGEAEATCEGSREAEAPDGSGTDQDNATARLTACAGIVVAADETDAACEPPTRAPNGDLGEGGEAPPPEPVTEQPEAPSTEVLGEGGVAPGTLSDVAPGSGLLPSTGRETVALAWVILALVGLGASMLMAARSGSRGRILRRPRAWHA